MAPRRSWTLALAGGVLLLLGLGALNYTRTETAENHRAWAARTGAPPPSPAIRAGGWVVGGLGLALGVVGLRRRTD